MKRTLVISDTHVGHKAGLCPPSWRSSKEKLAEHQKKLWDWYATEINKLKPIHTLVVNGDLTDGSGFRVASKESEHLANDQIKIAVECVQYVEAKNVYLVRGTPYHVMEGAMDYEDMIGDMLGLPPENVGDHLWTGDEKTGPIIDFKHRVSGSIVPYGRNTAPKREQFWNLIWADRDWQPKATVIVRSHVHYYSYQGDPHYLVIVTPALQLPDTLYGGRMCSGTVDVGFIRFDIEDDGRFTWAAHLMDCRFLKHKVLPL